jgi:hypothetical protein
MGARGVRECFVLENLARGESLRCEQQYCQEQAGVHDMRVSAELCIGMR